jgi:hypothetical protein
LSNLALPFDLSKPLELCHEYSNRKQDRYRAVWMLFQD